VPRELTATDLARIEAEFVAATHWADEAGFDLLELQWAHGYLLSSFISAVTNRGTDDYGGDLAARLRFPSRSSARCGRRGRPRTR
jgi:anthraniloyl-CoA monooxygenase